MTAPYTILTLTTYDGHPTDILGRAIARIQRAGGGAVAIELLAGGTITVLGNYEEIRQLWAQAASNGTPARFLAPGDAPAPARRPRAEDKWTGGAKTKAAEPKTRKPKLTLDDARLQRSSKKIPKRPMTKAKASEHTGIGKGTINRYIKSGKIAITNDGRVYVPQLLDAYIATGQKGADKGAAKRAAKRRVKR